MVSVVSSSRTGGNFNFFIHLNANFVPKRQKCQICVIYENLDCRFCIHIVRNNIHILAHPGRTLDFKCFSGKTAQMCLTTDVFTGFVV